MSDIEIARKAKKKHIKEIASKLNLQENDLRPYGHHIAKIDMESINKLPKNPDGSINFEGVKAADLTEKEKQDIYNYIKNEL